FGETGNLDALVYKFDLPLILEPDSADGLMTFDIDLTSDEVDDIAFSVSDKLDPSTHIRLSAVYALNDSLQILLAVQADTNFISYDYQNPDIPPQFESVYYNRLSGFNSLSGNDEVASVNNATWPAPFDRSTELSLVDNNNLQWRESTSFSISMVSRSDINGPMYRIIQRGEWNELEEKYFLYRIKNGKKSRYGWFKIGKSNFGYLEILEYCYFEKIPVTKFI
nr:hypothetical protein [Cryomorphaceae bacterium]